MATFSVTYTFVANTKARAAEVNQDFADVLLILRSHHHDPNIYTNASPITNSGIAANAKILDTQLNSPITRSGLINDASIQIVTIPKGGTGLVRLEHGELITASGLNTPRRIAPGNNGDVMQMVGTQPQWKASPATAPVGTLFVWAGTSAAIPAGWLLCDGSAVSRTTYSDLFGILSTTYGSGDGSTTFNLPNLKGKIPVGLDSGQTEFDTLAETGGAKTHTLTTSEIPSHSHGTDLRSAGGPNSGTFISGFNSSNISNNIGSADTSAAGGGGSHNNLQPYIVMHYIVKY